MHEIQYLEYDYKQSRKEITADADEVYDRNCEYGGSTGGIDFHDIEPLITYSAARDWLEDYAGRMSYYQGAVPYYEFEDLKPSAKLVKLREQYKTLNDSVVKESNLRYLSTITPRFVTCKKCESKINRETHLNSYRSNYCPVCGNDLRPVSTLDRIKVRSAKCEELKEAIKTETENCCRKQIKKAKKMWLVRIEYHV